MTLQLLGGRSVRQFLTAHWQKKPLVVRNAIASFPGALQRDELFRLAARHDVEARLVQRSGRHWTLDHGPFRAGALRGLPKGNWTLLVQGLNLHNAAADRLLRRFCFIPYARLDDVMLSYAAPGGGVGPHIDSYDVFLIQGAGERRWRIGRPANTETIRNAPLRILKRFAPEEEHVLGQGDLLYLPPGWAHDGVALNECMTYSIGFRAPAQRELVAEFLLRYSERLELPGLYEDPGLRPQAAPAAIPESMVETTAALLSQLRFRRADIVGFLGEYLSEPKPTVVFQQPRSASPLIASLDRFATAVCKQGIRSDSRTLLLYGGGVLFINGERLPLKGNHAVTLRELANRRALPPGRYALPLVRQFHAWYVAGWIHVGAAASTDPT